MARSQGWLCCSACNPSCQPHARAYALSSLVRELGARSWLWQLYELDGKSEHQHFAASQLVIIHLRRHFGTLATFTVKMAVESCSRPVVGSPESRVLCVVCTSQTQWRGTCTLLLSCLVCYYASPIGRQDSDHVAYLRALCVVYLYGIWYSRRPWKNLSAPVDRENEENPFAFGLFLRTTFHFLALGSTLIPKAWEFFIPPF